jgi:hypothetical protein
MSSPGSTLSHLTLPEVDDQTDWGDRLYHSPLGLFGFQAEGAARAYWQHTKTAEPVELVLWDTGIGKTHLAMAEAALLFEDDLVDHVVVVVEKNKILDWGDEDFPTFTRLDTKVYAGTPAKKKKILADLPQVIVLTYETGRNDICHFAGKSRAVRGPGPLAEALLGKRVLIVFDEFTKMRTRSSKTYVAWDYLINRWLRRAPEGMKNTMASGMTASTVESSPEDHFNACRVLAPWRAPSVEKFYADYVKAYDQFSNPIDWKNLRRDADLEPGITPLNELFAPITLRKRKTDQDVIEQFPAKVENPPRYVPLSPKHAEFYLAVEEVFADTDEATQRQSFGLLRQIAGHPMSLLRSQGQIARGIVDMVGAQGLSSMGSAKSDEMLAWAHRMGSQQMVIFTFYGQSILPYLHDALGKDFKVSINHGGLSSAERQHSQREFKAGDTQIFLSSDAGARGLNLGCGSALLHYDLPLLYSIFNQRSDRIHRIDSRHASVTIDSLVAGGVDGASTVENPIASLMVQRNAWSDAVIEDEAYVEDYDPSESVITAAQRAELLARARRMAA